MSEVLRYPRTALLGDYARAGAGLAITALPLTLLEVNRWIALPLAAAALLFALFALRTAQRQASRLELDGRGATMHGPLGARLAWTDLRGIDLRYYSTKRDRSDGWMQLTLRGDGRRLRADSTLDGFDRLVEAAAAAAVRNGVALAPVTVDNLLAMGIDVDSIAVVPSGLGPIELDREGDGV
ncbi:hypothetical protein [Azospirillum oleiclasticum]|uniref:hypothetical protein n=1 Tax=Azospirillum oleiclasticum TaxID=2735135 RepID=UPI0015D4F117|nr:hypothetical protein [Azospirillum oleiclasticum]